MKTKSPSATSHKIDFDEAGHVYRVGGIQKDSVTQILKAEGFIDTAFFNEEGAYRGTYVHRACELDDVNDLDDSTLKPEYLSYLEAWRKCKRDLNIRVIGNEKRLYSKLWDYTGTLDKLAVIDNKAGIIDLKTGQPKASDRFQVVAYQVAYEEEENTRINTRMCVYLRANGTYVPKEFSGRNDRSDWLSIVHVHNLKKER